VAQETDKIKQHIDDEREDLGRKFQEIEYRLKDATDLKAHFDRNTGWILGAAAAGGFILGLAFNNSSQPAAARNWESESEREVTIPSRAQHSVATHLNRVSETVDDIFAGLVGVFANKLQSFVADAVPGFREQYDNIKH